MPTFGPSGTPGQVTVNLDALFATSLANYQRTLVDNITRSNVFFNNLAKKKLWQSEDGGAYIQVPLMYGLATPDSFSGYDVLSTDPTDGITSGIFSWAQGAVPAAISGLEELQNRQKIVQLITAKVMQAEIGLKEFFLKAFLQGSLLSGTTGAAALQSAYVSPNNGSSFINPLFQLISYDGSLTGVKQSTASLSVGGIQQSSALNSWWSNFTLKSAATTTTGFLLEWDNMYDVCSRGAGGPPDIIWVDETTKRLLNQAYYAKFSQLLPSTDGSDGNFPFDSLKFRRANVVCDEFMVDVANGTTDTTAATSGTAVFINSNFLSMKYDPQTNFRAGDFKQPINQDAKVKQILWAGQSCITNRRKQGVIGAIARSLT